MSVERVTVEADGGSRGNPGPAGYGALVRDPATGTVLAERAEYLGVTTNNVAEYSGLVAGLRAAAELGARRVDVRMDSKLVVEQMAGRWKVKHPGLRPLHAEASGLLGDFAEVTFTWIPRARNTHADALANKAMDAGQRGVPLTLDTIDAVALDHPPDAPEPAGAPEDVAEAVGMGHGGAIGAPAGGAADAGRTRMILVRHAATDDTRRGAFCGRGCDPELSDIGRMQAVALADRLAGLAPDAAVLTSPLARARATADAVAARLGTTAEVEPDLAECAFGAWEGLTFAEIQQRWPDELAAWLGSTAVAPPEGESIDAADMRFAPVLAAARARYAGRTVVVVGHGTMVKLALRDTLGAGRRFLDSIQVNPAGLSVVDTWPDGTAAVRTINETTHL
ncbi:MAG TPA: bifunctional RNase H/acid phosphatase [Actinocatenispora sp.]